MVGTSDLPPGILDLVTDGESLSPRADTNPKLSVPHPVITEQTKRVDLERAVAQAGVDRRRFLSVPLALLPAPKIARGVSQGVHGSGDQLLRAVRAGQRERALAVLDGERWLRPVNAHLR